MALTNVKNKVFTEELTQQIMQRVNEYLFIYKGLALNKDTVEEPLNCLFAFFASAYLHNKIDSFEFYSYSWPRLTLRYKDSEKKILVSIYMMTERNQDYSIAYFGFPDPHVAIAQNVDDSDSLFYLIMKWGEGNIPRLTKANKYYNPDTRTVFLEILETTRGLFGCMDKIKEDTGHIESEDDFANNAALPDIFSEEETVRLKDFYRFLFKRWFRLYISEIDYPFPDDPEFYDEDTIIIRFKSTDRTTYGTLELHYSVSDKETPYRLFLYNDDDAIVMTPKTDRELEMKLNYHLGLYTNEASADKE